MFCKIILPNNEIHVIQAIPDTFDELYQLIQTKFQHQLPQNFSLKYKDSDDELVLLLSDDDLKTAILTIENEKLRNLRIVVVPDQNQRNGQQKGKVQSLTDSPLKDQVKRLSSFGKSDINQIPLTESITELPSDENKTSNPATEKENTNIDLSMPWKDLALGSEAISQFCSPINKGDLLTSATQKSFFARQNSLPNDENCANLGQSNDDLFSQDQIKIIADIIEKNINKQIFSKLEGILSEAVLGFSGGLKSSINKKGIPHISPLSCTNLPAPTPVRLSIKRCKELTDCGDNICNECKGKIKDIRYNCLNCKDYNCCESCENSTDHPHALLKIRIPKLNGDGQTGTNSAAQVPTDKSHVDNSSSKLNANLDNRFDQKSPLERRGTTVTTSGSTSIDPQGLLDPARANKSQTAPHTTKPLETCDVKEFLRYKVAIVKEPLYDVIRVKAYHDYSVDFTIKNAGVNKWANRVSLICINGIHKGIEQEIPNLFPGQEYVVNLYLTAPADCGRFLSQWQFHSFDDGVSKPFGKPIYIEIDVSPGSKEQSKAHNEQIKRENAYFHNGEKKDTRQAAHKEGRQHDGEVHDKDIELMKEMQCSEHTLKNAKLLNDMFPGEIKEKISFVNENSNILNINDLVSAYLDRLSASCTRRSTVSAISRTSTKAHQ